MEVVRFMAYTAASHQGAIKVRWLYFWAAVMLCSIYVNSLNHYSSLIQHDVHFLKYGPI